MSTDLMDAFEDVAVEREYANILSLLEKYPDFFAQRALRQRNKFPSMDEYIVWLCDNLGKCPNQKTDIFNQIQEAVNLNKGKFRIDRHQSVGMALSVVASLVNHNILLSLNDDTKTNGCKKIFLCDLQENQEMCRFYKDKESSENEFYECSFFNAETGQCLCIAAIENIT